MRLPPYPRYKPSGVEWLGDVPEHWEVKRLRHVVARNDGGVWGDEDDREGTMILRSTEQTLDGGWRIEEPARRLVSESEKRDCLLEPGDLVVTKSSGSALHIGKTSIVTQEVAALSACFSNFMQRLRMRSSVDPRLAFYLLNSPTGRQQLVFNSNTTTGLANLTGSVLGNVFFGYPDSLGEQHAIANFLDRETAKIDTLVAKKWTLIERLKEKRTALISRTVTRGLPPDAARAAGLDPHPKLKPSGIDWLGDVPEHWEVVAVRRRAVRVQTGSTPPTSEDRYYEDGIIPWYGPGSFDEQIVLTRPIKLIHESAAQDGVARVFAPETTFIVTIGATLGKVSSIQVASSCNQQITAVEFDARRVHAPFATYQLKRLEPSLRAIAPSATLPILDQEEICDLFLALPPRTEQVAIADFLDRETAKIDGMVSKVETAIERVQEYRTGLITAAVTGKIDVRGARA